MAVLERKHFHHFTDSREFLYLRCLAAEFAADRDRVK